MDNSKKYFIVGGGALGLFTAYFLVKQGAGVIIADEGDIPGIHSCSSGNAGMIVPSHFLPLANKSTLREGITSLFKRHSPMGVNLQGSPELLKWLWRFYRYSTHGDSLTKAGKLAELHTESRSLYKSLQDSEIPELTINLSGLAMVSTTLKSFEKEKRAAEIAWKLGMPAEIWDSKQYQSLNTHLDPQITGAVFYPWDGHLDPLPMLNALKTWLRNSGVEFLAQTPITGFSRKGSRIKSALSGNKEFDVDEIILCSGSQTPKLLDYLGLELPIQPAKGISEILKNSQKPLSHPTLLQDQHIAITPYERYTRLAGNFLLGDRTSSLSEHRFRKMHHSLREVFPKWQTLSHQEAVRWYGQRPVTPDGLPVIGNSSVFPNLWVNSGHAMMGISLAPVSGKILAEILSGTPMQPGDLAWLSPQRFGNRF